MNLLQTPGESDFHKNSDQAVNIKEGDAIIISDNDNIH